MSGISDLYDICTYCETNFKVLYERMCERLNVLFNLSDLISTLVGSYEMMKQIISNKKSFYYRVISSI